MHHHLLSLGQLFVPGQNRSIKRLLTWALAVITAARIVLLDRSLKTVMLARAVCIRKRQLLKTYELGAYLPTQELRALLCGLPDKDDGQQVAQLPDRVQLKWQLKTELEKRIAFEISLLIAQIRYFTDQNLGGESAGDEFQEKFLGVRREGELWK